MLSPKKSHVQKQVNIHHFTALLEASVQRAYRITNGAVWHATPSYNVDFLEGEENYQKAKLTFYLNPEFNDYILKMMCTIVKKISHKQGKQINTKISLGMFLL